MPVLFLRIFFTTNPSPKRAVSERLNLSHDLGIP
jgi:hypothetical protein